MKPSCLLLFPYSSTPAMAAAVLMLVSSSAAFAQTRLAQGHADIGIAYEDGAFDLHVHQEEPPPGAEVAPGDAILSVGASAQLAGGTPNNAAAIAFFGPPGSLLWVLPKTEQPDLLFLGFGTEDLVAGDSPLHQPPVIMAPIQLQPSSGSSTRPNAQASEDANTQHPKDPRPGLENLPRHRTSDPRNTRVGADRRGFPWGGIVAAGVAFLLLSLNTRADGTEERISLSTGHVDLRIDYDAGRSNLLEILVSDDDQGLEFPSTSAVLVVAESARLQLPADLPPLGSSGDSLWVVPQSQDPSIVFLGVSAEHNPDGIFAGALQLRLLDVRGPGDFFFWQSDLGSLNFFFDSSDGFGPEDSFPQLVGGHSHGNWGFTTNGVYFVTLQAVGQRSGETTNIVSPPTVLEFHVEPVPAILSPFQQWQVAHWPNTSDPLQVGPEADPDRDGRKNLEEYALGTDPNHADLALALTPTIRPEPITEPRGVEIQLQMRRDRAEVETHLLEAPAPTGPWTRLDLPAEEIQATGDAAHQTRVLRWKISFGVAPVPVRFYRVGYQLKFNP